MKFNKVLMLVLFASFLLLADDPKPTSREVELQAKVVQQEEQLAKMNISLTKALKEKAYCEAAFYDKQEKELIVEGNKKAAEKKEKP